MFRLKELRLENGLKRSELAEKLGLHPNTIANYENELRQASYETLVALARFFDVTVDYLLGVDGALPAKTAEIATLKKSEKELLACYRSCSPHGQTRIREFAQLWCEVPARQ